MAVVIAVIQQKGGVGKTTIVGNLAGEFVHAKHRVVVFDLDPQQSLTAWAGLGEGLLKTCVRSFEIGARRAELFAATVAAAAREADVVLLDCPPGLPEAGKQAAMVADLALLPVGPSPLDLLAVRQALDLMEEARQERGGKLPAVALVPSKVGRGTVIGRDLPATLKALRERVLPGISQRVVLAEVVLEGLTARESVPVSESAAEFRTLARAVERLW